MEKNELYARMICAWRGADPDLPITMGKPDGTTEVYDPAWTGYLEIANQLIEAG